MPVIPHATWFFDSVGLLLRADAASSSPASTTWEMDAAEAIGYIEAISEFARSENPRTSFASPLTVALLGGEPIAHPAVLTRVLDCMSKCGLAAEIWTTGAWVQNRDQAEEILAPLQAYMHAIRLSTNSRLMTGVADIQVQNLLEAARALGIVVDIHCGVAPGLPIPRQLLSLEAINNNTSFIHFDPVYDVLSDRDRAASDGGSFISAPSRQRCAEKFGFYIAPGGAVYPCWAGVGYDALRIGDLSRESVAQIVRTATEDRGVTRLRERGPAHLHRERSAEAQAPVADRYLDNCDFHRQFLERAAATTGPTGTGRPR